MVRDQELEVTHHVGLVYEQAGAEKDHATVSFLKTSVDEQHKENASAGSGRPHRRWPESLYIIGRELTALAERKEAAAA